jgi:HlyD family secretion protein
MTRKKVFIGIGALVVIAAVVYANLAFKRNEGVKITAEAIAKRNLEAIVSASGKIQAKRTASITSEVTGKVTRLAVEEGDRVKAGQFLIEIDSRIQRTNVDRSEANLERQKIALQQARVSLDSAKVQLQLAQDEFNRQSELRKARLATQQDYDRAENNLKVQQYTERNAEQAVASAEQAIKQTMADLENAQHDLSKVTITAPFDGIITKRNVEVGETAMAGFTNNPSVVLLTLADMSIIEAEIEVDETDVPSVAVGQPAKITIDALPDQTFKGHVTEVGNSPIQATTSASAQQATNFKVVVTVDDKIPDVRPGFTCTADITTATRTDAVAVPIQALTAREMTVDADGNVVRQPAPGQQPRTGAVEAAEISKAPGELPKGQTKKELEGVFLVKDGKAEFVPVKTGIAGDKYCEVLSGLKPGDSVITGPFSSVRELTDGKAVAVEAKKTGT